MNTDNFANFGVRFLEILSLEFPSEVANSEILGVVSGLLRTNDYETVAQCLSFVSVLAENASLHTDQLSVQKIVSGKLLTLMLRTVAKQPEVEYLHYML